MAEFPAHPDAVTVDWLSDCLSLDGARIMELSWDPIGTGQVGDSVRFHLTYDRPDAGPATLAGKFPAADAMSRGTAAAFGLYAKEVGFYRELQPYLSVRTPEIFAAEIADNATDFILLFEDLGPARGGDQLTSCSFADACAAMPQAAAIHAPSWNNPALIDLPWLQPPARTSRSDQGALSERTGSVS